MPSFGRPREPQANAIVGAARRIHINRADEIERMRIKNTQEWQRVAWMHYDAIGEIKYAFNYFASVASRCRLYVGYQTDDSEEPVPIGTVSGLDRSFVAAARYELRKLSSGRGGQPNLLRSSVLNLLVTGELYLVGHNRNWAARSTSELRFESDNRVRLVTSRNAGRDINTYLPSDAYIARIWRTHPQYSDDSDSSLKGVEDACSELILLSRIIRASSQSRLNAGILYVADELRFEKSSDVVNASPDPDTDPFEEELTVALTEPVGQTDSPSEIVPMIVRGPADFIDKGIKHIDISRGFDKELVARHDQTLSRVLNGLDLPKDLVTGVAHVRYANSMTIAEDMLKAHVEPMILLFAEGLGTAYLKPQMLARGYDQSLVDRMVVWYDPTEVVTRADRSEDADKGYERMLVSGSAWRRSHGFSDSDAPTPQELITRIALSGVVPPETTVAIMRAMTPEMVMNAEKLADNDPSRALLPGTDVAIPKEPGPPAPPPGNELPSGGTGGRSAAPIRSNEPAPGGILPPRDNPDQPNGSTSQLLELLAGLTAGATRQTELVTDRTRRLELALDVERRLRESLSTYLNGAVHRSLERAGARTISKVRGVSSLKVRVRDVPIEEVFSRIPRDELVGLDLDEKGLVSDTLEKARDGYVTMVRNAQLQGWQILSTSLYQELAADQDTNIERSWRWLSARLIELAVERLRNPAIHGSYVDISTVRNATALAGGAEFLADADPDLITDHENSGRAILSVTALNATKWTFGHDSRWVYGVGEATPDPHFALDGRAFSSWEADELRNFSIGTELHYYYPGDNALCRCDWLPVVTDPHIVNAASNGHREVGARGA